MKRNRRRAFALVWAVPAWLRGVAVGARTLLDVKETAASGRRNTSAGNGHRVRAVSLTVPALSRNAAGQHACTGCQRCAEVCPSRCLEVAGVSESVGGEGVERFALDLARCIGCGDCVAVCPESALRTEPVGSDSLALMSGDLRLRRDLLAEEATA